MARILIHDFGGYPAPFELAKYWAGRGHDVRFCYFQDVGELRGNPDGAVAGSSLRIEPIKPANYRKYRFLTKPLQDRSYGRRMASILSAERWDFVVSSNTPLDAQAIMLREAQRHGASFVYWLQDLISAGIKAALQAKGMGGRFAAAVAAVYRRKELNLLKNSDRLIMASPMFRDEVSRLEISTSRAFEIENWNPLGDVPMRECGNRWAKKHGLAGQRVVLYAGTLGLKHNPVAIVDLAERFRAEADVKFVVVGEGPGRIVIEEESRKRSLENVSVLGFQPYEDLPDVLGAASVLLALNDGAAASFCYPSKVLTYFCAARPVLGLMPKSAYAAELIGRAKAGLTAAMAEPELAEASLRRLLTDRDLAREMGESGRRYAEERFEISRVGQQFDAVLTSCLKEKQETR